MAERYSDVEGVRGAVEHEAYCMPSEQKENVDSMTNMMGYHEKSDLANNKEWPSPMVGEHRNVQLGPELPNPQHNDRSEHAGD